MDEITLATMRENRMPRKKSDDAIPLSNGVAYYMGDDTFIVIERDEEYGQRDYVLDTDKMKRMLASMGDRW
jgi:hypothetical protein